MQGISTKHNCYDLNAKCYPEESAANTGRHKTWTLIPYFPLVHSKLP